MYIHLGPKWVWPSMNRWRMLSLKPPHYLQACTKNLPNMEDIFCKTTNSWPKVMLSCKRTLLNQKFSARNQEINAYLEAHALQCGPSNVCLVCIPCDSNQHTSRIVPPPRSKQPTKCRHKVNSSRILYRLGKPLNFTGAANNAQVVTQPLHSCPTNCNRPLQRIVCWSIRPKLIWDSCQQPVLWWNNLLPRVQHDETTCAIGALGLPRFALLAKSCRMLIAQTTRQLNTCEWPVIRDCSDHLRVACDFWQNWAWNVQSLQCRLVPLQGGEVHEHCSGCVCAISCVNCISSICTACHIPD